MSARGITLFWLYACFVAAGFPRLAAAEVNGAVSLENDVIPEEAFAPLVLSEVPAEDSDVEEKDSHIESATIFREMNSTELESRTDPRSDSKPITAYQSMSSIFEETIGLFGEVAPGSRDSVNITVGSQAGYNDNVFTTNIDRQGSGYGSLFGTAAYSFGPERLQILLRLSGGVTYYDNRSSDPTDYNGIGSFRIVYRASPRLSVDALASVQYLSQPDPTLIGNVSRFAGDYTVTNLGLSVTYTIRPRWSVSAGYQFLGVTYADEAVNQNLGYYDQNFSLSLAYLLSPRASLVAEYRYNPLLYYESNEGSDGHLVLLGFDYSISPKATWSLRGGGESREIREPAETSESSYLGPFVESDFAYSYAPDSRLALNLRYGTEPSGVSNLAIRQTFRASMSVDHAFTPKFIGNAAIYYQNNFYDQPGDTNDFEQSFVTGVVGLRYRFRPSFAIFGRYEYSAVTSDIESSEYTRNLTALGFELFF